MRRGQIRFFSLVAVLCFLAAALSSPLIDNTQQGVDAQAARARKAQAEVRAAIELLNSQIAWPKDAPSVSLEIGDLPDSVNGQYNSALQQMHVTGRPVEPSLQLTLLHEAGHYFDMKIMADAFLPKPLPLLSLPGGITLMPAQFSSREAKELQAWRKAVRASKLYQSLRGMLTNGKTPPPSGLTHFILYVTSDEEMWARSFAQTIAARSGSALSQQTFDFVKPRWPLAGYWNADDFGPVSDEVIKVLESRGWLHPLKLKTSAATDRN